MRNLFIGILVIIGIGVLYIAVQAIMFFSAFGGFDKDYSVTELKENFEKKKTEIYHLRTYFNQIVPTNKHIEIEFEDDNTIVRLGITPLDTANPFGPMFLEWDLNIETERMDSIIKPLGWTRETLKTLKAKLDKANCIGIENSEPTKISYQRSGMGMYSFIVFDKPMADSLKGNYNDGCRYILVNDSLALEYGGGAVGGQCFYNLD